MLRHYGWVHIYTTKKSESSGNERLQYTCQCLIKSKTGVRLFSDSRAYRTDYFCPTKNNRKFDGIRRYCPSMIIMILSEPYRIKTPSRQT